MSNDRPKYSPEEMEWIRQQMPQLEVVEPTKVVEKPKPPHLSEEAFRPRKKSSRTLN